MTIMSLNCLVRVLRRNFISHTYFCVIFRGGRWEAWSFMLSFSLGTSILTWCTTQLWWWHELRWRSIFSTTISFVLQLWVLFLTPVIFLMTSPYLLFIPLFIPQCTHRMRRQLTSESSSYAESQVSDLRCGRGFICTQAVPHGNGHVRKGGYGDASNGVGNGFVPYWMLIGRVYSSTY